MGEVQTGSIIQKFRKENKLTIKELAEKVNITSSMLSQIERGQANPSINTVRAISQALDIPLFKFFMENEEYKHQDLIVNKEKRMHIILEGNDYQLLTPTLNSTIEFMMLTLEPGSNTVTNPTSHKGEEVAFIVEGTFELILNSSIYNLSEGDSVRIPPNMCHKWRNPGNSIAKLVFAITPPEF